MKFRQEIGKALRWVSGKKTPDKEYITRVFNFGTREEWHDLHQRYSRRQIRATLSDPLKGQWTRRGKGFAEAVYHVRLPAEALINYEV